MIDMQFDDKIIIKNVLNQSITSFSQPVNLLLYPFAKPVVSMLYN